MPARFTATNNAIEKGLENATPKSAIGLIDGWLAEVEKNEFTGSKGIHSDLERLKKELEKDQPNGEAVQKIVGKLGAATTKSADRADDDKVADQLRKLGEALTSSGTHDGDDA